MAFWIDTHCHLDAPEFDADRSEVRAAGRSAGVVHCVIPAVERSNWATVRELAHAGGDSYALGIHPLYTPQAGEGDLDLLALELAAHRADPRLLAVGEIGLDFFVPGLDAEKQLQIYRAQIGLARRFDLPVILHVRQSSDRLLQQLRATKVRGGIAHAFNGSAQQAQVFIDLGFKLGFGGALTYERAHKLRRLAAELPLSALVLETDAPDIPPHWVYTTAEQRAAGLPQGRNSPAELPRIAEVMAGLRGISVEALAEATSANACAALPGLAALNTA
ncbi:TatD family hydrolase [Acidovorax sp. CCYZU-2555]|uniref:TatD family hydrolase n=1 Tax=Acidovorax sp. CCYZU-2555 TaxID=2835042 RepID=UPI001BCBA81F|nr:TatD family hydrolase [Acidovorax sp. CCYZU-2555]MBS7781318.1 TatD family hydrolase [Acidovorax sp. CCYZU-2555]